jgi:hypothetical protein
MPHPAYLSSPALCTMPSYTFCSQDHTLNTVQAARQALHSMHAAVISIGHEVKVCQDRLGSLVLSLVWDVHTFTEDRPACLLMRSRWVATAPASSVTTAQLESIYGAGAEVLCCRVGLLSGPPAHSLWLGRRCTSHGPTTTTTTPRPVRISRSIHAPDCWNPLTANLQQVWLAMRLTTNSMRSTPTPGPTTTNTTLVTSIAS